MKILEPKKGKGLCFSDIKRAMLSQGYSYTDKAITDNFKVLLEQGKIVKVGRYYGLSIKRDDGTRYIETPANKTIAVWKVKPDGQSKCEGCDEFGYYEWGKYKLAG